MRITTTIARRGRALLRAELETIAVAAGAAVTLSPGRSTGTVTHPVTGRRLTIAYDAESDRYNLTLSAPGRSISSNTHVPPALLRDRVADFARSWADDPRTWTVQPR